MYEIIIRFQPSQMDAVDKVFPGKSYTNDVNLDPTVRRYQFTQEELIAKIGLSTPAVYQDVFQIEVLEDITLWAHGPGCVSHLFFFQTSGPKNNTSEDLSIV